ncbi:PhzF family phenazine biosynthesis protein [Sporobolomyces koalae]|uniref:PhzF family phenazine biosynthesis protein n=1 Tax=Sporobolomyces koalae TaxID=500713 RepID=UPI003180B3F1
MLTKPPSKVAILDAFTSEAYKGNPAAVVLSVEPLDLEDRQRLAIEFNQPATAFVSHPSISAATEFASSSTTPNPVIRWHTATGASLGLCGHATMAASVYLLDYFVPTLSEIRYHFYVPSQDASAETAHELVATRNQDGRIEISLPASRTGQPIAPELKGPVLVALKAASGVDQAQVEAITLSRTSSPTHEDLTIQLTRDVDLGALVIDSRKFLSVPYRGIFITNLGPPGSEAHFRSRVFFPSVGILEDQVCGHAHTRLGPYWIEQLAATDSPLPEVVEVNQVSPRGGRFALRWDGKSGDAGGKVCLRGKAKRLFL